MDKLYYKEYYELERKHWFFRARAKIIFDHLKSVLDQDKSDYKILNVGPATGYTSELLEQFGDVVSVEFDKDCLEFVKSKLDINIMEGSILDLPFDQDSFDLVCAFDVVEHVEDDKKAVSELQRVCKEKGIVCVTVPAFQSIWSKHDEINHHFKRYRKNELNNLFDKKENIFFSTYFNFFLFIPVAIVRIISYKILKIRFTENDTDTGSDLKMTKENFLSVLLYRIFSFENTFIKKRWKFPFGVSILTSWKK